MALEKNCGASSAIISNALGIKKLNHWRCTTLEESACNTQTCTMVLLAVKMRLIQNTESLKEKERLLNNNNNKKKIISEWELTQPFLTAAITFGLQLVMRLADTSWAKCAKRHTRAARQKCSEAPLKHIWQPCSSVPAQQGTRVVTFYNISHGQEG